MTTVLTLLLAALSLLTQVSSMPNISPELKTQAIQVANMAIQYATENMATSTPVNTTIQSPQQIINNNQTTQTVPIFGSITPMQTYTISIIPNRTTVPVPTPNNDKDRQLSFTVSITGTEPLDSNALVHFHTPSGKSIGSGNSRNVDTSTDLNLVSPLNKTGGKIDGNTITFTQGFSSYFDTSGEKEDFTFTIGDQSAISTITIE